MSRRVPLFNNTPRYILQWGVLLSLIVYLPLLGSDPEKYSPMAGLQALASYLVRGNIPGGMTSVQIVVTVVLVLSTMLLGKLFCGYICPVGTVEDLLVKLRKSISLNPIVIRSQSPADKALRMVKYILLYWIIYSAVTFSVIFSRKMDPYYAVMTGFSGETVVWMGVVSIILVVLFGLFIDNFFCRYICPLGAACNTFRFSLWIIIISGVCYLAIMSDVVIPWWIFPAAFCIVGYLLEIIRCKSALQLLHVYKNVKYCNKCHDCDQRCPYGIEIGNGPVRVDSVDCTLCGECVTACRTRALHIGMIPSARRNFLNILLPACLAAAISVASVLLSREYEIPVSGDVENLVEPGDGKDLHDARSDVHELHMPSFSLAPFVDGDELSQA